MISKNGDADAGRALVLVLGELVGLVQGRENFFTRHFGLGRRFQRVLTQVCEHQHELITTQTRHGVTLAHTGFQPSSHLLQQQVANVMTQRVVEGFEMIQIDEQQRRAFLAAAA